MNTTTERTGPKAGPGTIATTRQLGTHPTEQTRSTRRIRWRNRSHLTRIAKRVAQLEKQVAQIEATLETHIAKSSDGGA